MKKTKKTKNRMAARLLMAALLAMIMAAQQSCTAPNTARLEDKTETRTSRKAARKGSKATGKKRGQTPKSVLQTAVRKHLPAAEQRRLEYLYIEATKQKMAGNYASAFDICRHLTQIAPDAPELHYDLGIYQLMLGRDTTAIQSFRKAAELDPANTHYKEIIATYYIEHGDSRNALPALEALSELEPTRSDVLAQLVQLYRTSGQAEEAIRVLDRIETLEGVMPAVAYQKFALYQALDKPEEAFACLDALCKEYPHELRYRLTIGDQLLAAGRIDEAKKIYDEVQAIEPNNKGLQLSYLEYYRATGADSLFTANRDRLLFGADTDDEIRVALMRDYIASEVSNDSIGHQRINDALGRLTAEHPTSLELFQLQAAYLATYEKQDEGRFAETMEHIIELEPANTQAVFYLIQYYGTHQEFTRLEALCRRAVITHPDELVCHYYLGVACWQLDKKEDALKAFQDGIVQKTEESRPTMVADLFCLMGDVLHELGREEESYAAYDSCLVYQDDNVGCLNNYAYYLSLQGKQLDKAEDMSYRTVRIHPSNKTYLDTYAWILFVKGRYAEAQAYIDKVVPPDSTDAALLADPQLSGAVLEHAGDIAARNGNPEQALRMWQLAAKAGGEGLSANLPKKIKLKKYVK